MVLIRPEDKKPVSHRRLSRLLKAFRQRRGEPRQAVELRLPDRLKGLESPRSRDELFLSVTDLHEIAKAYDVHRLMLDPLLTRPESGPVVVGRCSEFMNVSQLPGETHLGVSATYTIPQASLKDTDDVAFVHLTLGEGGYSDVHDHPGEELMYVRKGQIELRFMDSGQWTRLEKGAYCHFYSEQLHGAWNVGAGDAELFVIRFYQLAEFGTRLQVLHDLTELMKDLSLGRTTKRSTHLLARVIADMGSNVDPFGGGGTDRSGAEVLDRFGMGRFLRLVCSSRFQGGEKSLSLKELEGLGVPGFTRSKIDRLHNGLAPVRRDELPSLEALYGVPAFLFFNYLYPSFKNAISVRLDDYAEVPRDFITSEGVTYSVPRRRLSDTDLALARVVLKPGASTPPNRHPGHELILVLRGEVGVRAGGSAGAIVLAANQYAHYSSVASHRVENVGRHVAEFIAVRFQE